MKNHLQKMMALLEEAAGTSTETDPTIPKSTLLPLDDVDVDFEWNCRLSIGDDVTGAPEEQHRFEDLVESLAEVGQDTPVVVRRLSDSLLSKGKKYRLVAGFRRFAAFRKIYQDGRKVPGLEPGYIRCEVRSMSDTEAEALNGRENIARENLTVPDIAKLVVRLKNRGLSDASIGQRLGISQIYANRLRHAYETLRGIEMETGVKMTFKRRTAFEYWRERPYALTVTQVYELGKVKEEDRERIFKQMLTTRASGRQRAAAVTGKALQLVQALIRLEHAGFLLVKTTDWTQVIQTAHLIPLYKLNDEEQQALSAQCEAIAENLRRDLAR